VYLSDIAIKSFLSQLPFAFPNVAFRQASFDEKRLIVVMVLIRTKRFAHGSRQLMARDVFQPFASTDCSLIEAEETAAVSPLAILRSSSKTI